MVRECRPPARAGEVLAGAPLDDGNVDLRQHQLARQHQPLRTSSGDHHRMLGHSRTLAGVTPGATGASNSSAAAGTVSNCAATNSAARRGGAAPVTSGRTGWPTGTSGTPTPASSSAKSGGAHPHPRAECPQLHRESHHRFDVPVRLIRRQQRTHFATPISVGSGFGRHYPARPGACRKPPVRYILGVERSGYSSSPLSRPLWTDDLTVGEWLDAWLSDLKPLMGAGRMTYSTYKRYAGIIRKHLKPALGHRKLKDLTVPRSASAQLMMTLPVLDDGFLYHRDFKSLLKRAGLWSEDKGKRFTFHSLRHTCATLLLSKNVNPKIVQEMLGHATITQTMDTYSHVLPGMGDVAATALEEALG
jgi:hypothetical protein